MKKAFTIIEIIVAIFILLIGVLGISLFFASSTKISRKASLISIGSNLAQGFVDEETTKSYEELTPGNGTQIKVSDDLNNSFYNFSKQINISLIDSDLNSSTTDEGLKKIDVFVFWKEGTIEKNVQMSTIKSKK